MNRNSFLLIDGSYLFKGSLRFRGSGQLDYQLVCKYLAEQVGLGQNPDGFDAVSLLVIPSTVRKARLVAKHRFSSFRTYFADRWYFNASPEPQRPAQRSFNQYLQRVPPEGPKFKLRLFPMKKHVVNCPQTKSKHETQVQKGVDVAIATKMMELVFEQKPERILLVAGDGDFLEAVKTATRHHIEVVVVGYRDRSVSSDLQSEAQRVIWLDEHWGRMVRQGAGQQGPPLPPPEDLADLELLGIDLAPPPGMELNDGSGIAPETFDVLARILSMGDQGGSQYPPPPSYPPPPPSGPPSHGPSTSTSRSHRDHSKRPYYASANSRRPQGVSPPRQRGLSPARGGGTYANGDRNGSYRRDRYEDPLPPPLPPVPRPYEEGPYYRPATPPRPNGYEPAHYDPHY